MRLGIEWFGGLITRKSHERTNGVFDYRVHLEADQSVRNMKLPLAAYSTESNSAVGACGFAIIRAESRRASRCLGAF